MRSGRPVHPGLELPKEIDGCVVVERHLGKKDIGDALVAVDAEVGVGQSRPGETAGRPSGGGLLG